MFNLKQGTLKFLLNASIDTLPTAANLHKWKKSTSDQCKLCKARETTCHILNNCTVSLLNGKYLWRHNNIVNYVMQSLDTTKYSVFSVLPGYTVGGERSVQTWKKFLPFWPFKLSAQILLRNAVNQVHQMLPYLHQKSPQGGKRHCTHLLQAV